MVRLKDIAEACGVSVATVSRALNGLTNENKERTAMICQAAREMGYYPNAAARTLKTSRSFNIGILYEERLNHEYFSSLLDDLRGAAEEHGYDLTLLGQNTEKTGESYYDHARRRNLDGIIIMLADFESENVIRLVRSDMPVVSIDHVYEHSGSVNTDNFASIEQIVRFVYSRGHRRIGFVTGHESEVCRERLAAFRSICAELGLALPEEYIREGRYHNPELCAARIRDMLREKEKPTCILCPDDYSCLGAMLALTAEGIRIPGDVSLTGYDGIRIGSMIRPALTTYRQDTKAIAREAIRLLLKEVETPGEHRPSRITLDGTLIEGETVSDLN